MQIDTYTITQTIAISFILYAICRILDDIEKKQKRKQPKTQKRTQEEIIQKERRRNRWARRKAKKHINNQRNIPLQEDK